MNLSLFYNALSILIVYPTFIRHGDSEFAQRKERRIRELNALKTREETLNSLRKVSDHQVEQLKGALVQLKNEAQATRSEHARIQRNLGNLYLT